VGKKVVELDRPLRPARRAGAKSDVIDAERPARDARARTKLAAPKTEPHRTALAVLLAGRRSAVDAASTAQRQLRALVITAPEQVRARFRGHSTPHTDRYRQSGSTRSCGPGGLRCSAFGVPNEIAEDEVMACVVPAPGATLTPAELVDPCVATMPSFAVPRCLDYVAELPKNPMGRVLTTELRDRGVTETTWDREKTT